MSWVWWVLALWVPLAVLLAVAVSRAIRIADRRERGISPGPAAPTAAPHTIPGPRESV